METLNTSLTVEAWADIVIREWVKMAATLGIAPDHPLTTERFRYFLTTQADGNIARITFTFDYYLKFVNWGVGRGVTIENRDTLIVAGKTSRRRRPWYDDVFPKQLNILGHLLSERYAQRTVAMIKTTLETISSEGASVSIPHTSPSNSTLSTSKSATGKITYAQFQRIREESGW
jgi:hypothetical protein